MITWSSSRRITALAGWAFIALNLFLLIAPDPLWKDEELVLRLGALGLAVVMLVASARGRLVEAPEG